MDPLTERDEWRCVRVAGNGGQFALGPDNMSLNEKSAPSMNGH